MIYVGYQGIGKSTLCNNVANCVDLESGNFFVDGKRCDDWYKIYANIASHLSGQGKDVFVSSHKVLREYMAKEGIAFVVIYPSIELKDEWIEKLKQRYELTKKEKDLKALLNAQEKYEENIDDLSKEKSRIIITSMDYSLSRAIKCYENIWGETFDIQVS